MRFILLFLFTGTLKEAAAALGLVDPSEFDNLVNPADMISPRAKM